MIHGEALKEEAGYTYRNTAFRSFPSNGPDLEAVGVPVRFTSPVFAPGKEARTMRHDPGRQLAKGRPGFAVLAGLWITLLGAGPATGATPIAQADVPLIIDQPGKYVVVENLSSAGGQPAITIRSDHVDLDLNGFALSGPVDEAEDCRGGVTSVGIASAGSKLRLAGGTVQGFGFGILLSAAGANRLDRLTVTGNCACGILSLNSSGNHVSGNDVSANFGTGVCLSQSEGNRFHANRVNGNSRLSFAVDFGFLIIQSAGNVITSNDISGNGGAIGGDGIIMAASEGNVIRNNIVNRNTGSGIQMAGSTQNNTIRGNVFNENLIGIRFTNFNSGNLVEGNTATGNVAAGIFVDFGSTANIFRNNMALSNFTDLADFNSGPGCPNTWRKNTFVTEGGNVGCIQ
jgi:parallel beta-helix repeat protein